MLRSLFSLASIVFLFLSTFISPAAATSRRCPVEPPKTLLRLYRSSDSIHIGSYDRIEDGAIVEETADYTALEIRKHFSISSTLKGEPKKFITLEDKDYRYRNAESTEPDDEGYESESDLYMPRLEPGDTVILFLKKGEGEDSPPVLADWNGSIKKLSKDEIESYELRLNELAAIFANNKATDEAVLRWIIDAARDPNTRWEGAFELLQSFQAAAWSKQRQEQIAEMKKNGEDVVAEPESSEPDTSIYSQLLTDAQKSELLSLALETNNESEDPPSPRRRRGDSALIDLVSLWGDSRFATFLANRLRNDTVLDHYERLSLMSKIADVLKDAELSSISSKFSDVVYQDDNAIVDEDGEPAVPVQASAGTDAEARGTYHELRETLIAQFLSRSDAVITAENNRNTLNVLNN